MEVVSNSYMPGDPRLIDHIVYELKSQGIFDHFRKECIADVDTKPAYQNLRQRVEGSVSGFLRTQKWRPDMNKNHVREMLRKNISESGFLEIGVERIVDQVVNPKINTIFLPQVENVVYKFLGIEKPSFSDEKAETATSNQEENDATSNNLLPSDLEAVSPDSETHEKKTEPNTDTQKLDDSRIDEEESPPFEPLEETTTFMNHEDNSVDSHLSGFSGLASHDSNHSTEINKIAPMEISNQDSQLSKQSSDDHLSIAMSDETDTKMEINEEDDSSHSKTSKVNDSNSKGFDFLQDQSSLQDTTKQEQLNKKSEDKAKGEEKKSDKHRSSDSKHRSRYDSSKSDSKDRKNDKDKKSERDKKENRDKTSSRQSSRDGKDRERKHSRSKSDKEKSKNSSSSHSSSSRDKSTSKKYTSESRSKENPRKEQQENTKSRESSEKPKEIKTKHKEDLKFAKTESRSHSSSSNRSKTDLKSKQDKNKGDSSDSNKNSTKSSRKDEKHHSKYSSSSKKDDKHDKKDPKRDSSKKDTKDDHYSSKGKKSNRRSTDRDSSDGHSGTHSSSSSLGDSKSQKTAQDSSALNSGSSSSSGDSGNSDQIEEVMQDEEIIEVAPIQVPQVKLIKPKFASNIFEARRLMKIRKQLSKIEKQNQMELINSRVALTSGSTMRYEILTVENDNGISSKHNRGSEEEENDAEEVKINEQSGVDLIQQHPVISQARWDAIEAKLNSEIMLGYKFNTELSGLNPNSDNKRNPIASEDENEQVLYFSPIMLPEIHKYLDKLQLQIRQFEESIVVLENECGSKHNRLKKDGGMQLGEIEKRKLPKIAIVDVNIDNEIVILPSKGLKRQAEDHFDVHNNNNRTNNTLKKELLSDNYTTAQTKVPNKVPTSKTKKAKLIDNTGSPMENFSLPLSPADSDKSYTSSNEKKGEKNYTKTKRNNSTSNINTRMVNKLNNQRYSSDDLYKPRLQFSSSRRRGAKITDVN